MTMSQSTRRSDLLAAFSEPRCPVCKLVLRDMEKDLFNLYQDRINKVETHLLFRAGRGLCNAHAHQMMQAKGAAISVAVMYESAIFELLKDADRINPAGAGGIGRLWGSTQAGAAAADKLEPTGLCLMCASMNTAEDSYTAIIAQNCGNADLRDIYEASVGGVCLPHARMVLRKLSDAAQIRWLLDVQREKWRSLQAELEQFIRNNEDNIPHWQMGVEGDSWQRAVRYLSGDPQVFGYRRHATD